MVIPAARHVIAKLLTLLLLPLAGLLLFLCRFAAFSWSNAQQPPASTCI